MTAPTIRLTSREREADDGHQHIDPELDRWLTLMGIPPGSHVYIPSEGMITWEEEDQGELQRFIKHTHNASLEQPPPVPPEAVTAEIPIITQTHTENAGSQDTTLVTREYIKTALNTKVQQRVMKHRIDRASRTKKQTDKPRNQNAHNAHS